MRVCAAVKDLSPRTSLQTVPAADGLATRMRGRAHAVRRVEAQAKDPSAGVNGTDAAFVALGDRDLPRSLPAER